MVHTRKSTRRSVSAMPRYRVIDSDNPLANVHGRSLGSIATVPATVVMPLSPHARRPEG